MKNFKKDTLQEIPTNPKEGDIIFGKLLNKGNTSRFIWRVCPDCKNGEWVLYIHGKPRNIRCFKCSLKYRKANNNVNWRGGRWKSADGYIWVYVSPNDFYHSMCSYTNYVMEHRLVMAKSLNRCLLSWEVVHHKNGIKSDNRLENLELLPYIKYHLTDMVTKSRLAKQSQKIQKLKNQLEKLDQLESYEDEDMCLCVNPKPATDKEWKDFVKEFVKEELGIDLSDF